MDPALAPSPHPSRRRRGWAVVGPLLIVLSAPGAVRAFHDGGVASCGGCHVMHETDDGMTVVASGALLRAESASDVCLACHANANGAVFGLSPLAPPPERGAGNFVFLYEDDINDDPGGVGVPVPGEAAGHSIVSPSMGVGPDSRWVTAPGGSFPSAELGCTSCHDPHGNQNYRMLYGRGPVQGGIYEFVNRAPEADGISLSGPAESPSYHNAYLAGWSRWCANCHGLYHDAGTARLEHPVDRALGGETATWYAQYAGDANLDRGVPALSYLPDVPYEDPVITVGWTGPPDGSSRIMCLSCHRAHASSAPAAGRWDFRVDRLEQDGGPSGSYPIPSPYPGPEQGQLCSKCHAQSEWSDAWPPLRIAP